MSGERQIQCATPSIVLNESTLPSWKLNGMASASLEMSLSWGLETETLVLGVHTFTIMNLFKYSAALVSFVKAACHGKH